MWPRFNRNDLGVIAHYLGILVMTLGVIMLVPLTVSLLHAEWAISGHYLLGMGVSLTLGALLRLAKIEPQRMGRKHAIAITGMVWIVGALLGAIPLFLSGHYASYLDAVFEGVSGFTATGLSLVLDIDHMSMGDNMWRFTMQFVGGQGVVVVALSLGIFTRTGNALYASEAREESVVPNIKNTARFILRFSTAAVAIGTIVLTVILFTVGMEPLQGFFHALWITIGAYDTGGFAPGSLSLIPYHSWPLEIVAMLLMMFGALSFAVVAQVHKGNWRELVRDIEVRTLALWTTGMVVIFVAALTAGDFLTDFTGVMRRGIFTIVSATTNTGFQVLSTAQITTLFSSGAFLLVAVAMAVGGSSASTAGGIKALRVGLIIKGIGLQIKRVLQPRSAQITTYYNHIGRHQLAPELLSAALIIAALYVISYVFGALVGIAFGYEALHATFESISAASNAGLTSGIVRAGMPVPLEILYIIQMWLGRLEFITLLALFGSLIASFIPRPKPKPEGQQEAKEIQTKLKALQEVRQQSVRADRLQVTRRNGGRPEEFQKKRHHNPDAEELQKKRQHDSDAEELQRTRKKNTQGSIRVGLSLILAVFVTGTLLFATLQNAHAEEEAENGSGQSEATAESDKSLAQEADEVTIDELALVPEHLDFNMVRFEGEVVGNSIRADDEHIWITLADSDSSISVYLPRSEERYIEFFGDYAHTGTRLVVVGELRLACDQHDGSSDVHAAFVDKQVDPGKEREHQTIPLIFLAGFVLIVIAGALFVLYDYLSGKRR